MTAAPTSVPPSEDELFARAFDYVLAWNLGELEDVLAEGDPRSARLALALEGRLSDLPIEDQFTSEWPVLEDWLGVQVDESQDRYAFVMCTSRKEALATMLANPQDGHPSEVCDLRTGEAWAVAVRAELGDPLLRP